MAHATPQDLRAQPCANLATDTLGGSLPPLCPWALELLKSQGWVCALAR